MPVGNCLVWKLDSNSRTNACLATFSDRSRRGIIICLLSGTNQEGETADYPLQFSVVSDCYWSVTRLFLLYCIEYLHKRKYTPLFTATYNKNKIWKLFITVGLITKVIFIPLNLRYNQGLLHVNMTEQLFHLNSRRLSKRCGCIKTVHCP